MPDYSDPRDVQVVVEAGWMREGGVMDLRFLCVIDAQTALGCIAGSRAAGDCTAFRFTTQYNEEWVLTTSPRGPENQGDPLTVALIRAGLDF